jgi:F-type H+-transporting ATPase subunit a
MFITINIIYLIKQKIQSPELFLPSGTPLFILPFLIQIEIVSYFSRVIILSVRLFANMTSGHTLIKILSGFGTGLSSVGGVGTLIAIIPIIIVFIVTGL